MDMEEKEIERILQKAADNISIPDYKEVYAKIKGQLGKPVRHRRIPLTRRWKTVVASACSVLIGGGITLSVAIPVSIHLRQSKTPVATRYFVDDLVFTNVDLDNFYLELRTSPFSVVDFSDYAVSLQGLYQLTEGHVTQGGYVEFPIGEGDIFSFAKIKFFSERIKVDEVLYSGYTETYSIENGNVKYKLNQIMEEDGLQLYDYVSYAKYNNVTYLINYLSPTNDITEFFDSLFH